MTQQTNESSGASAPDGSPTTKAAKAGAGQDFARQAEGRQHGALVEMWNFLRYSKKWWLTPIVLALILIAIFLLLSTTAAGPLIYTLF